MSELEALLLGIVQGLTEFLPISSSGHLILVPWLQDYTYLETHESFNKTFDVALHAGTLGAVVWYFRRDLWGMARAFVRTLRTRTIEAADERLAWAVIVGTVPAVIVGGLGESWIDRNLGEPWMIAILLAVFGLVLAHGDRRPETRGVGELQVRHGLLIGVAQALALAPGTSRSGITITVGRYLHFDRDAAARVSFLLLVPATAGATALKAYGAITDGLPPDVAGPLIVGTIAAAASGYVAIAGLLAFVRTRSYDVFVWYRVVAATVILALIASGALPATF